MNSQDIKTHEEQPNVRLLQGMSHGKESNEASSSLAGGFANSGYSPIGDSTVAAAATTAATTAASADADPTVSPPGEQAGEAAIVDAPTTSATTTPSTTAAVETTNSDEAVDEHIQSDHIGSDNIEDIEGVEQEQQLPEQQAESNTLIIGATEEQNDSNVAEENPLLSLPNTNGINIPQATTSFSLFSDPNRFSIDKIQTSTHYLTNKIQGITWLDENGDGKRGHYTNSTLNDLEFTNGVGEVGITLIDCSTDLPVILPSESDVSLTTGEPSNAGKVFTIKSSINEGTYTLPFTKDSIPNGRYYLMYSAPVNYRISGNVLPLARAEPHFDCLPYGGEGDAFITEARRKGDLDITGYCARSIGCFEVDYKKSSHEKSGLDRKYSDLEVLNNVELSNQMNQNYNMFVGSLAAIPSKEYFNVGLAKERWLLPTYQYADAQITLTFPPGVNLTEAVPQDFLRSTLRREMEVGFGQFLGTGETMVEGPFDLRGVDLNSGSVSYTYDGDTEESSPALTRRRYLREGEPVRDNASIANQHLTYTITTRGSYRPPPFKQLGELVEDSINKDPDGLVKTLKEKDSVPEVFDEVKEVKARRLTTKEEEEVEPLLPSILVDEGCNRIDCWALIPVITMSACIIVLIGAFIFRRGFVRRKSMPKNIKYDSIKYDSSIKKNGRKSLSLDKRHKTKAVVDVKSMSTAEIEDELESYGFNTDLFEDDKRELVDTLVQARKEGMKPIDRRALDTYSSESSSNSVSPPADMRDKFNLVEEDKTQLKMNGGSTPAPTTYAQMDPNIPPTYMQVDPNMTASFVSMGQNATPTYVPMDPNVHSSFVSMDPNVHSSFVSMDPNVHSSFVSMDPSFVPMDHHPNVNSSFVQIDPNITSSFVSMGVNSTHTHNSASTASAPVNQRHEAPPRQTTSLDDAPPQHPKPRKKSSRPAARHRHEAQRSEQRRPPSSFREKRLNDAARSLNKLKVSELKKMLDSLGVDSSVFLEKKEFVEALAEARVDGTILK